MLWHRLGLQLLSLLPRFVPRLEPETCTPAITVSKRGVSLLPRSRLVLPGLLLVFSQVAPGQTWSIDTVEIKVGTTVEETLFQGAGGQITMQGPVSNWTTQRIALIVRIVWEEREDEEILIPDDKVNVQLLGSTSELRARWSVDLGDKYPGSGLPEVTCARQSFSSREPCPFPTLGDSVQTILRLEITPVILDGPGGNEIGRAAKQVVPVAPQANVTSIQPVELAIPGITRFRVTVDEPGLLSAGSVRFFISRSEPTAGETIESPGISAIAVFRPPTMGFDCDSFNNPVTGGIAICDGVVVDEQTLEIGVRVWDNLPHLDSATGRWDIMVNWLHRINNLAQITRYAFAYGVIQGTSGCPAPLEGAALSAIPPKSQDAVPSTDFIKLSELQVESSGETFTFAADGEHELARQDDTVTQFSVRAKIHYRLSLPQASLWIQALDSNTGDPFGAPQSLGTLNDTNGFDLETVTPPAVYNYPADGTQISFQLFFRTATCPFEDFAESTSISVTVKTLGPGDRKPPPPITMRSLLPRDSEPEFMTARGRSVGYESFVDDTFQSSGGLGSPGSCEFGPRVVSLQVRVGRFLGPTDADGFLQDPQALIQEQMVAPMARLRIAAYDVDSEFQQTGNVHPERDRVTINGFPVQNTDGTDWLKGADNQWRVTEFLVPINRIKLPSAPASQAGSAPVAAINEVKVDIDTANSDPKWCTSIDWAMLSVAGMAPLMLVHGTNADSSTWDFHIGNLDSPVQLLTNRGIPFGHPINLAPNGEVDINAFQLGELIEGLRTRFGTEYVHLVTHSKGATDSRWMLAFEKDKWKFKVLSLFSIGTPSQGTVASDLAVAADANPDAGGDADIADGLSDTRNAQNRMRLTPQDPARTQQKPENMKLLNDKLNPRRPPEIPYFSIAGDADQNGNQMMDLLPEWEGVFVDQTVSGFTIPRFAVEDMRREANTLYWILGRFRNLRVVNGRVVNTPTARFEPNDLVSTVASTHCSDCGFEPLGTFNLNHTALKNPEVIELVIETIKKEFPLPK